MNEREAMSFKALLRRIAAEESTQRLPKVYLPLPFARRALHHSL